MNNRRLALIIAIMAIAGALLIRTGSCADAKPADKKISPAQTAWEASIPKGYRHLIPKGRAMSYVAEDPRLPRVLLIGDSISIGYTVPVRKALAGKANVLRIPTNGGPSSKGVKEITEWLGDQKWDVIHFNWGLHDCFRKIPKKSYKENLEKLVATLKATNAQLIWASSTPIPEGNPWKTPAATEVEYNAVAKAVMDKNRIPINDLHSAVTPHFSQYVVKPGDVHFKGPGNQFLGKHVVAAITAHLPKKKSPPAQTPQAPAQPPKQK